MAFNPFESFRKNSKTIIAVMAIICMFTFVLSSGTSAGGDFFDWLGRQFGEGRRGPSREEVATYFGKPITRNELEHVRRGRAAANQYMLKASFLASRSGMRQLEEDFRTKKKINDPDTAKAFAEFFKAQKQRESFSKDTSSAEIQEVDRQIQQAYNSIAALQGKLDEKTQPEEFKAINKLLNFVQSEARYIQSMRREGGGMYFITSANQTELDALEFDMLLRKADQMGFEYTDDQITALIAVETDNSLSEKDAALVESEVRQSVRTQSGPMSSTDLLQAIGNEFRARTMVAVLKGDRANPDEQLTARPMAMTPWEFFKYYRDNCSESAFRLIEVPIDPFLADVKEQPDTQELIKLFNKYSRIEAKPDSEKPGFKQPNRAVFEYISIDTKSPFYEKIAPLNQAVSTIAAGITPTLMGGGPVAASMHIAQPFIAANLPLEESLQRKVKEVQSKGFPSTFMFPTPDFHDPRSSTRFRDNVIYHPLPFAALASQLAFPGNIANLTAATANQYNLMFVLDAQDRVKSGFPAFQAGFGWGGLPETMAPPFPLAALVPAAVGVQAPVATGVYRQELKEKERKEYLQKVIREDREAFIKKLNEYSGKIVYPKPSKNPTDEDKEKQKKADEIKAEALKYIDDFAKGHGFQVYRGQKLDDRFDVREDPSMKPLVEAAGEARRVYFDQTKQEMSLPIGFDELEKLFEPSEFEKIDGPLFHPIRFPQYDDRTVGGVLEEHSPKQYLVWRIEDVPAKDYSKWDELPKDMKDRVIRAWKMQRARELAKKQADALAENLRTWAGPELQKSDIISPLFESHPFQRKLLDVLKQMEGEQHKTYRTFTLTGFAKLKRQRNIGNNSLAAMGGGDGLYGPPQIPDKDVRFPSEKMIPELLDIRDKSLGETIVLNDAPKSHYYVACLIQKREKEPSEFITSVYLRSSIPESVKSRFKNEENRANEMIQRMRQGPNQRQSDFLVQFFKQQAAATLGAYDPLLFPTAFYETEIPTFKKDFLERLKLEGNFKGNDEELKKLAGKDKDGNN